MCETGEGEREELPSSPIWVTFTCLDGCHRCQFKRGSRTHERLYLSPSVFFDFRLKLTASRFHRPLPPLFSPTTLFFYFLAPVTSRFSGYDF